jgi:ribonuclease HI
VVGGRHIGVQSILGRGLYQTKHFIDQTNAPEWLVVQRVVQEEAVKNPASWEMLERCARIEAYTDGSAPLVNPGGPAGFAAVVIGWTKEAAAAPASEPDARVDLAGFLPMRISEPPTSNNRAEVTGIIAALALLCAMTSLPEHVSIRSDSDYAINCALGRYKRKKNLDLWACFDTIYRQAQARVPEGISMEWLRGHAGHSWNQAADELATRAAFNFDDSAYQRYRSAQRATGREMPNNAVSASGRKARSDPTVATVLPNPNLWIRDSDYTVVLASDIDSKGQPSVTQGPASGRYLLWTKSGKGARCSFSHAGERQSDEAEYLTLIAALDNLLARIVASHKNPGSFSLTVYSRREIMIKQLQGAFHVRAVSLQPLQAHARTQLDQFSRVELIWKQGPAIKRLLSR